jgi:hypothetical protein
VIEKDPVLCLLHVLLGPAHAGGFATLQINQLMWQFLHYGLRSRNRAEVNLDLLVTPACKGRRVVMVKP